METSGRNGIRMDVCLDGHDQGILGCVLVQQGASVADIRACVGEQLDASKLPIAFRVEYQASRTRGRVLLLDENACALNLEFVGHGTIIAMLDKTHTYACLKTSISSAFVVAADQLQVQPTTEHDEWFVWQDTDLVLASIHKYWGGRACMGSPIRVQAGARLKAVAQGGSAELDSDGNYLRMPPILFRQESVSDFGDHFRLEAAGLDGVSLLPRKVASQLFQPVADFEAARNRIVSILFPSRGRMASSGHSSRLHTCESFQLAMRVLTAKFSGLKASYLNPVLQGYAEVPAPLGKWHGDLRIGPVEAENMAHAVLLARSQACDASFSRAASRKSPGRAKLAGSDALHRVDLACPSEPPVNAKDHQTLHPRELFSRILSRIWSLKYSRERGSSYRDQHSRDPLDDRAVLCIECIEVAVHTIQVASIRGPVRYSTMLNVLTRAFKFISSDIDAGRRALIRLTATPAASKRATRGVDLPDANLSVMGRLDCEMSPGVQTEFQELQDRIALLLGALEAHGGNANRLASVAATRRESTASVLVHTPPFVCEEVVPTRPNTMLFQGAYTPMQVTDITPPGVKLQGVLARAKNPTDDAWLKSISALLVIWSYCRGPLGEGAPGVGFWVITLHERLLDVQTSSKVTAFCITGCIISCLSRAKSAPENLGLTQQPAEESIFTRIINIVQRWSCTIHTEPAAPQSQRCAPTGRYSSNVRSQARHGNGISSMCLISGHFGWNDETSGSSSPGTPEILSPHPYAQRVGAQLPDTKPGSLAVTPQSGQPALANSCNEPPAKSAVASVGPVFVCHKHLSDVVKATQIEKTRQTEAKEADIITSPSEQPEPHTHDVGFVSLSAVSIAQKRVYKEDHSDALTNENNFCKLLDQPDHRPVIYAESELQAAELSCPQHSFSCDDMFEKCRLRCASDLQRLVWRTSSKERKNNFAIPTMQRGQVLITVSFAHLISYASDRRPSVAEHLLDTLDFPADAQLRLIASNRFANEIRLVKIPRIPYSKESIQRLTNMPLTTIVAGRPLQIDLSQRMSLFTQRTKRTARSMLLRLLSIEAENNGIEPFAIEQQDQEDPKQLLEDALDRNCTASSLLQRCNIEASSWSRNAGNSSALQATEAFNSLFDDEGSYFSFQTYVKNKQPHKWSYVKLLLAILDLESQWAEAEALLNVVFESDLLKSYPTKLARGHELICQCVAGCLNVSSSLRDFAEINHSHRNRAFLLSALSFIAFARDQYSLEYFRGFNFEPADIVDSDDQSNSVPELHSIYDDKEVDVNQGSTLSRITLETQQGLATLLKLTEIQGGAAVELSSTKSQQSFDKFPPSPRQIFNQLIEQLCEHTLKNVAPDWLESQEGQQALAKHAKEDKSVTTAVDGPSATKMRLHEVQQQAEGEIVEKRTMHEVPKCTCWCW